MDIVYLSLLGWMIVPQLIYSTMVIASVWSYQTRSRFLAVLAKWASGINALISIPFILESVIGVAVMIIVSYCCWRISSRTRPSPQSQKANFSNFSDLLDDFR